MWDISETRENRMKRQREWGEEQNHCVRQRRKKWKIFFASHVNVCLKCGCVFRRFDHCMFTSLTYTRVEGDRNNKRISTTIVQRTLALCFLHNKYSFFSPFVVLAFILSCLLFFFLFFFFKFTNASDLSFMYLFTYCALHDSKKIEKNEATLLWYIIPEWLPGCMWICALGVSVSVCAYE